MNQREASKQNWRIKGDTATIEEINSGSFQLIADATELMASNFIALQNDMDMYKRWYNERVERNLQLYRRISALQGVITKMKKKARGH